MKSFQIRKWQDNIAEDIQKEKKTGDENLINAILEVANQLAEINENSEDYEATEQGRRDRYDLVKKLCQAINFLSDTTFQMNRTLKGLAPVKEVYRFYIFGRKLPCGIVKYYYR